MTSSSQPVRGVIHGRTIELEFAPGLPDGQEVAVSLQPLDAATKAILETAGAWADDAGELDGFLNEMRRSRDVGRFEPPP
jgi:hypothetical protein